MTHPALVALGMGKKVQRAWVVLDDWEDQWWETHPLPSTWEGNDDPIAGEFGAYRTSTGKRHAQQARGCGRAPKKGYGCVRTPNR